MVNLNEEEQILYNKIIKLSQKFDKRINELLRQFAIKGNLEVNDDLSFLSKQIFDELKSSGLQELYNYMLTITNSIKSANIEYYANITNLQSDITKSNSVKFVTDTLTKNLTGDGLKNVLAERIANTIKPYILSNADLRTTTEVLSKVIPKEIERYTTQITKGAFSLYDGAIQNTIKQKYNPTRGRYSGHLVETSRPFCIYMRDTFGNRNISIDELQLTLDEYCPKGIPSETIIEIDGKKHKKGAGMLEGTTVDNFDINKGGATNNCHHYWRWIID